MKVGDMHKPASGNPLSSLSFIYQTLQAALARQHLFFYFFAQTCTFFNSVSRCLSLSLSISPSLSLTISHSLFPSPSPPLSPSPTPSVPLLLSLSLSLPLPAVSPACPCM